ncbi:PIG-L family deacetylase [Streptomyces sp. NBC_01754]|uniref:PIG-L deacetylase family protein n=1 Tax=Streptomyces sp. NBC_01754 TaxID=2975930 RepID=UPI002DD7E9B8|nr:PIG-L family deacetylase [Streptomyces sp. NBC_01754]WSC95980.1 PIG-L family deacetylase [Streptomyces sp. NBC_01754]
MAPSTPSRTVVLSPHFDDAALSLAGLLPSLPGPVDVVTVHGGAPGPHAPVSWWDTRCGFSSAAEAHRARLDEDAAACALLGVGQIVLDHPDGPYAPEGATLHRLEALLRALPADTRILAPLGSNQPDHEAVRRLAVDVLADRGAPPPWVYADLPYTGHLPEWGEPGASEALARSSMCGLAYQDLLTTHRTTVRHTLALDDEQWAAKRAAVLCHGSQLAPIATDHGGFLARTGPLRAELIWSLEARDTARPAPEPAKAAAC